MYAFLAWEIGTCSNMTWYTQYIEIVAEEVRLFSVHVFLVSRDRPHLPDLTHSIIDIVRLPSGKQRLKFDDSMDIQDCAIHLIPGIVYARC